MSESEFKRTSPWVPTLIVLGVVLAAGARLIALSVQEHTTRAREAAHTVLESQARLIRTQLQDLASAAQGSTPVVSTQAAEEPASVIRVDGEGHVVQAINADRAVAQGIADELAASGPSDPTSSVLLGPMRQGSQWIVAVRAPAPPATDIAAGTGAGSVIAYRSLDELLARAQLGKLAESGYDFELSQVDPATGRSRSIFSSRTTPLAKAVRQPIYPPANVAPSSAGHWAIAIRPRDGWYPPGRFAGEIGLLGLVAWILALFVFDAKRDSRRLQGALSHSRRRLDEANDRLVAEIEERLTLQKSLEHARYHDAFTGLPNRRYFMDQLDRALRDVRVRRGQRFAVALIDIDRFKLITDTLGHPAGDEVMVQAARRFERAMATIESVLARWDGQRFAVLLLNVHSRDTALSMATLLQESLREPFDLRGHRLSVSAGMGVTHVESGLQRAEDVVREADIALSVAKAREGSKVLAYDGSMGGEVVSMVSLEADLHIALARDELRLLHQPIVELATQRIVGAEALLRWEHPVEGLLAPDKFLLIAEDTGLIVPITRWIIRRACSLVAEARRRLSADSEFYLSVNLSAAALRDPGLSEFVTEALGATSLPATAIKFEVTEASLISNPGAAREALARLTQLGVQLMLDDFGTGYSSLSHLQLFPFDYVKIDRPFVGQAADSAQRGVTSAMVQMASSLGLAAIAERVESEAAGPALQAMGCRFAQGFFFSAPVDAEELLRRLRGSAAEAGAPLEEDDSPTLVVPVLTTTSDEHAEWGQAIESVVIATAEEGKGQKRASPPPPPRPEAPVNAPQEAAPRRRSPTDPPTQPLADSPHVVGAQLQRTTGVSDQPPRVDEEPAEADERQDESLAARLRRRLRPGQAR